MAVVENSVILRTAVSIFNIALVPLVLPTYAIVIWMFWKKRNFQSVFSYKIMMFCGIFDCFYCFSMGQAGLMTYQKTVFFYAFQLFGASIQISYLSLAPVFSFLLALHRLVIVWRIRFIKEIVFKVLIVLNCSGAILIPIGALFTKMRFGYDIEISDTYYYDGKTLFAKLTVDVGFHILCLTFVCYFLVAVGLAYQKIRYGHTKNLSTQEAFLVLHAFLLFTPHASTRVIVFCCNWDIFRIPAVHAGFMMLSSSIPAVNLFIHLATNATVRRCFAETTRPKFRIFSVSQQMSSLSRKRLWRNSQTAKN